MRKLSYYVKRASAVQYIQANLIHFSMWLYSLRKVLRGHIPNCKWQSSLGYGGLLPFVFIISALFEFLAHVLYYFCDKKFFESISRQGLGWVLVTRGMHTVLMPTVLGMCSDPVSVSSFWSPAFMQCRMPWAQGLLLTNSLSGLCILGFDAFASNPFKLAFPSAHTLSPVLPFSSCSCLL